MKLVSRTILELRIKNHLAGSLSKKWNLQIQNQTTGVEFEFAYARSSLSNLIHLQP